MHDLFLNENGIENCIEPLSMKMLSVLFFINAQVPSDRHRSKTQDRGAQSHREGITEYAPSYALLHFFGTLTFCKTVRTLNHYFCNSILLNVNVMNVFVN